MFVRSFKSFYKLYDFIKAEFYIVKHQKHHKLEREKQIMLCADDENTSGRLNANSWGVHVFSQQYNLEEHFDGICKYISSRVISCFKGVLCSKTLTSIPVKYS